MRLVPIRQGTHLPQLSGCVKLQEVAGRVDDAVVLVDDHHPAGAHDGAGLVDGLVVDRQVEQRLGQTAARRGRPSARP